MIKCDLCGGALTMLKGGQSAVCKNCGMEYSLERVREMMAAGAPVKPPEPVAQMTDEPKIQKTRRAVKPPVEAEIPDAEWDEEQPDEDEIPEAEWAEEPDDFEEEIRQKRTGKKANALSRKRVLAVWEKWLPKVRPEIGLLMKASAIGVKLCMDDQMTDSAARAASKNIARGQSAPRDILSYYGSVMAGSVAVVVTEDRVYIPDGLVTVAAKCPPVRYADVVSASVKHDRYHKIHTNFDLAKTNELYITLKSGEVLNYKLSAYFCAPAIAAALNELAKR